MRPSLPLSGSVSLSLSLFVRLALPPVRAAPASPAWRQMSFLDFSDIRPAGTQTRPCVTAPLVRTGETTARSTPRGCFDARLCRSDERRRAALRLRAATCVLFAWRGTMRLYVAVILAYAASGKFTNFLRRIHVSELVSKLRQLKRL